MFQKYRKVWNNFLESGPLELSWFLLQRNTLYVSKFPINTPHPPKVRDEDSSSKLELVVPVYHWGPNHCITCH